MTDGQPQAASAPAAFDAPDAEALVDPRLRGLIERYVGLAGGSIREIEPHLLELNISAGDAAHFRGRRQIQVALSLGALERHPEAEMAVVGSAILQELIDAVRVRGHRRSHGLLPPSFSANDQSPSLTIPLRHATAGAPVVEESVHPLGKLIARVALSAGAVVEEHIVESGVFDLALGAAVSDDIASLCGDLASGTLAPAGDGAARTAKDTPRRSVDDTVRLMLGDLEQRLGGEITRRRDEAAQALAAELARIDRYYKNLLEEMAEDHDGRLGRDEARAVEAEHQRRRAEEERRHALKASVHPLQLVEFRALVQTAEWELATPAGRCGKIAARRALSGAGKWTLACPTCGQSPKELCVCRRDHVACAACANTCSVCGEQFCKQHGLSACHLDGDPACEEHARTCPACRRPHCTTHAGTCSEGGHAACTACLAPCGVCGRVVCATHAFQSGPDAPKGGRRLCRECVVYCEGGSNEPIGRDEAVRCASCDKYVCASHQATCAVDQQVHCSKHLRRADRSRRLACEKHRGQCEYEPHVILASDEVVACASCDTSTCEEHGRVCSGDGLRHCRKHLARLNDTQGDYGCEQHRSLCHVDKRAYTATGTSPCPVCGKATCAEHQQECTWCGRVVCVPDMAANRRCSTCSQLKAEPDPADSLIAAAIGAHGGEPPKAKTWKTGRDATHTVVELDLGWTRRLVFVVRHGDSVPQGALRHSLLGRSK